MGILSGSTSSVIFNVPDQVAATLANGMAFVEYYDANVVHPRANFAISSNDINGVTRFRLRINITNAMTGAAWNVNTTNLTAGTIISIKFIGYIL